MEKLQLNRSNALIAIVGILSFINLFNNQEQNYLSMVISIVGLVGVLLFIQHINAFRSLILVWITAQAIIIEHYIVFNPAASIIQREPVFNCSQVFNIKYMLYLFTDKSTDSIGFNFLTVLYYFLYWKSKKNSYIGHTLSLSFIQDNPDIHFEEGTYATLTQQVNLDEDNDWLLGQLNTPILYNQIEYDRLLVHVEDGLLSNVFRLVPITATIHSGTNPILPFEQVEWIAMIENNEQHTTEV